MILKIFQGFSLFSYQCSLFCSLATACLFYQIAVRLSSTFFIFLNSVLSSLSCDSLFILSKCFAFVKNFFHFLLHLCFKAKESAGGGIRTHAPLRTNGFQDRLVMTASISLQVVFVRRHQPATCTYYHFTIFVSTSFFKKFEAIFKSSGVVIFRFSYAPIITFVLTLL